MLRLSVAKSLELALHYFALVGRSVLRLPKFFEAAVALLERIIHGPTDLRRAFGTGVEWTTVGFVEVICAGHEAFVFCAMPHREHVSCLMHRDLKRSSEKELADSLLLAI